MCVSGHNCADWLVDLSGKGDLTNWLSAHWSNGYNGHSGTSSGDGSQWEHLDKVLRFR